MIAVALSEKGVRPENQDAILTRIHESTGLFVVADGVGGCKYGGAASRYLVKSCESWWDGSVSSGKEEDFAVLFDGLKARLEQINTELCVRYGEGQGCSTAVVLFMHGSVYGYLSMGDSRIYKERRRKVRLLTRDDTYGNLPYIEADPQDAEKIMSGVGFRRHLEYMGATDHLKRGTRFLLCSDGIYKYVQKGCIEKTLKNVGKLPFQNKKKQLDKVMNKIVKSALDGRTADNYSLIIVRV